MYKFLFFSLLLLSASINIAAQEAAMKGKLVDKVEHRPVNGATVSLLSLPDSISSGKTVSDNNGLFSFGRLKPGSYSIVTEAIGYRKLEINYVLNVGINNIGELILHRSASLLDTVTVTVQTPTVVQKGDTLQYNASQFKTNPDANAEDLIKKMPGITVDQSGSVTAQGEQVRKVTVDGRDFFGDDATAALRNLPAEVIDKIQVFDRLSEQAQFTGFDDGNSTKAINIVTKTGIRNAQFGRVYAGYGTEDRYAAGGNVSFFNGDRRLSLVGLFNNVNQQNFSNEDLLGVMTSGSGGGGRGGNRGGGGGGNRGGGNGGNAANFTVGQQNGISRTNAAGLNFSDKLGTKMEVTASYFFNNSSTNNDQSSAVKYFLQNSRDQFYDEQSISLANNFNHRLNMRMEYRIDSFNSFLFTPTLSIQDNTSNRLIDGLRYFTAADLLSKSLNDTRNEAAGFNSNNNLLYRHAFSKRGRTISVNIGYAVNRRNADTWVNSDNTFYSNFIVSDTLKQYNDQIVRGNTWSGNITYTEPIGKQGQLQFSYAPSYNRNRSVQEVSQWQPLTGKYSLFDTSLSSRFDNTVLMQDVSVTFRRGNRDNMFSAGLSFRHTGLGSEQQFPLFSVVDKSFYNWLPNLMWRRKLSPKASIRLMYRASTNAPTVTQLQEVINNTNPLFLTTGNPGLKQQTSNTLSFRYTYTNTARSRSFFANLFFQQMNNYITNATFIALRDSLLSNNIVLYKGAQLTKPVNLNGFISLRSLITYAMPIKPIKSNLNFNVGFNYVKTPGIVNTIISNTNNYTYTGGLVLSSNISEFVDFNVSYNINWNIARNAVQPLNNNRFILQNAGIHLNLLSKKGWFLQQDVTRQAFTGLSDGFNQNYWLWNAGVGRKFLKKQAGEIKLSVFDLLSQNRSIARNVTESYIEDLRSLVLTRYFMLTFSYRLRNFGTPPPSLNRNRRGPMPDGMSF